MEMKEFIAYRVIASNEELIAADLCLISIYYHLEDQCGVHRV